MRDVCILNADSPSYPPTLEEYEQCGCQACRRHLVKEGKVPSGNEVPVAVAGATRHTEKYYFKPGEPLPEHIPDPNARWQKQHDMAVSPCHAGSEHTWEVMLRCSRCGFLIRLENTPHPIHLVRQYFRAAYERIRSWVSSDTSAASF